jgi:hypothetical protein
MQIRVPGSNINVETIYDRAENAVKHYILEILRIAHEHDAVLNPLSSVPMPKCQLEKPLDKAKIRGFAATLNTRVAFEQPQQRILACVIWLNNHDLM